MARTFEYTVLRVVPDSRRGECVNIGLVIFAEGAAEVRLLSSLAKVSALNGTIDLDQLRELPRLVPKLVSSLSDPKAQHAALCNLGIATVTELGSFQIARPSDYEAAVGRLMRTLIAPVGPASRYLPANTRIVTTLKAQFKANRILGSTVEDLAHHLVVPNYPLDPSEGLYSDFVVKNGTYNVTETADLRASSASRTDHVRSASFTAIKLHKAKESFGSKTKRFVVYASRKGATNQAVNLIGDYSDAIFHLDSRADMADYMRRIMQAASTTQTLERAE